jgi:hypothetical protein
MVLVPQTKKPRQGETKRLARGHVPLKWLGWNPSLDQSPLCFLWRAGLLGLERREEGRHLPLSKFKVKLLHIEKL